MVPGRANQQSKLYSFFRNIIEKHFIRIYRVRFVFLSQFRLPVCLSVGINMYVLLKLLILYSFLPLLSHFTVNVLVGWNFVAMVSALLQATERHWNNSETAKNNEKWYERWSNFSFVIVVFIACPQQLQQDKFPPLISFFIVFLTVSLWFKCRFVAWRRGFPWKFPSCCLCRTK